MCPVALAHDPPPPHPARAHPHPPCARRYVDRDGAHMTSTAKEDFAWPEEDIEFMKAHGEFGRQHNRRRDEFVM